LPDCPLYEPISINVKYFPLSSVKFERDFYFFKILIAYEYEQSQKLTDVKKYRLILQGEECFIIYELMRLARAP